jgi:hypothetical protein
MWPDLWIMTWPLVGENRVHVARLTHYDRMQTPFLVWSERLSYIGSEGNDNIFLVGPNC